ncbi:MAG: TIGR01777 family protein [Acidobacteria bacterium]|nr:TIGR01777 family protein [Acidobacteriota bacterium]
MRVVISGASGFVGSWLIPDLLSRGIEVVRLVRGKTAPGGGGEASWDPSSGRLDPAILDGADVIVNLSGRNIASRRWTAAVKRELWESRIASTRTLVRAIHACSTPPALMISASATGVYGARDEIPVPEDAPAGSGFLPSLVRAWEQEAAGAAAAGTRVVMLRFGMIVGRGGALARMLPAFRLGLGGPVGNGRQTWPWIAMEDVLGVIERAMADPALEGPINAVAPQEVSSREFARTLGRILGRPAILPVPAWMIRVVLGEMGSALLLDGVHVKPARLLDSGYTFRVPNLASAIRKALD